MFAVNSGAVVSLNALTVADGGGLGGGIFNNGTLTVTNSAFSNNTAEVGPCILNELGTTLTVTNSTFAGNTGPTGAAIFAGPLCFGEGSTIVTNSTFAGNNGSSAIFVGAAAEVSNSILAANKNRNCFFGCPNITTLTNGGYNISDDASCGFGTSSGDSGQTIGDDVNPLLDPNGLRNNGGPTETIELGGQSGCRRDSRRSMSGHRSAR